MTIKLVPIDNAAEAIAEACGAKPGDTFEIVTPQFDREPGLAPAVKLAAQDFASLHEKTAAELRELGCRPWDDESEPTVPGHILYLFPAEWYAHIPEGFEIVDINGNREPFARGETDDDRRFGVLAYGVLRTFADDRLAEKGELK